MMYACNSPMHLSVQDPDTSRADSTLAVAVSGLLAG